MTEIVLMKLSPLSLFILFNVNFVLEYPFGMGNI